MVQPENMAAMGVDELWFGFVKRGTPPGVRGSERRRICGLGEERVAAEEAVQLLHFGGGLIGLLERFEPRQLNLEEP